MELINLNPNVNWNNIANKPATYPPETHTHTSFNNFLSIIGANSGNASLRLTNSAKTGDEKETFIFFNTRGGEAGYPLNGGLHLYSYNKQNTVSSNPISILDEGTICINFPLKFPDGTFQETSAKPSEWQIPVLSSNFINGFTGHQNFRYRKNFVTNSVEFVGVVTGQGSLFANATYLIATLPVGYRPTATRRFYVSQGINTSPSSITIVSIRIEPTGEIWITPSVNSTGNYSVWLEFSMPLI